MKPIQRTGKQRLGARSGSDRRGSFIVVAMVCLVVAGVLLGVAVSMLAQNRDTLQNEQWTVQAELLADSAIDRAVYQINEVDSQYEGETWKIPATELGGRYAAVVEISVTTTGDPSRTVTAEAIYPMVTDPNSPLSRERAVCTKTVTVTPDTDVTAEPDANAEPGANTPPDEINGENQPSQTEPEPNTDNQ